MYWTFILCQSDAGKMIFNHHLILSGPLIIKHFAKSFVADCLDRYYPLLPTAVFLPLFSKRIPKIQLGSWPLKIDYLFQYPLQLHVATCSGFCQWDMRRRSGVCTFRKVTKGGGMPFSFSLSSWLECRFNSCSRSSHFGPWNELGNRGHAWQVRRNRLEGAWVPGPWSTMLALDCAPRHVHGGEIDFFSSDTVIPDFLPLASETNPNNTLINSVFCMTKRVLGGWFCLGRRERGMSLKMPSISACRRWPGQFPSPEPCVEFWIWLKAPNNLCPQKKYRQTRRILFERGGVFRVWSPYGSSVPLMLFGSTLMGCR